MKYLIPFFLIGLLSCRDPFCTDQSDQTAGLVVRVLDRQYIAYQGGEDLGRFGIRISSKERYEQVFSGCCANRLDSIDFNQFEIVGLSTVNRGSPSGYLRDVQRDDVNKKITYTITEHYCQRSSPVDGQGNYVLIPKQPSDYKVDYVRNQ